MKGATVSEAEVKGIFCFPKKADDFQKGKKFLFSVGVPGKRTYYVSTTNDAERKRWVDTIKELLKEIASPPTSNKSESGKSSANASVTASPTTPAKCIFFKRFDE